MVFPYGPFIKSTESTTLTRPKPYSVTIPAPYTTSSVKAFAAAAQVSNVLARASSVKLRMSPVSRASKYRGLNNESLGKA